MRPTYSLRIAALGVAVSLALVLPSATFAAPVSATYVSKISTWLVSGIPTAFTPPIFGVAADGRGNLFVVAKGDGRVLKYDTNGVYLGETAFVNRGTSPKSLAWPQSVAIGRTGLVYVADYVNDCVAIYDDQLRTVAVWYGNRTDYYDPVSGNLTLAGPVSAGSPAFSDPKALAIDSHGEILVASLDGSVRLWDAGFRYIGSRTGFSNPNALGVDVFDNWYVSDIGIDQFYKLTPTLVSQASEYDFDGPSGVAGDAEGNVLVACDGTQKQVLKFDRAGALVGQFGATGAGDGQFSGPYGLNISGSGIFVSDNVNNEVSKWAPLPAGKPVTRLDGANRYVVAVKVAQARYPGFAGVKHVIVVCGEDRANADPLSAAGLAGVWDAPVLLTATRSLSGDTKAALLAMHSANGPLAIHVIGGTSSIPKAVYNVIASTNPGGTIERISGSDRYTLSTAIARRVASEAAASGKSVPGVLIINAENSKAFYDSLAASPIAARTHMPMIAVKGKSVPSTAASLLRSSAFQFLPRYAASGSGYISSAVYGGTLCSARLATSGDRYVAATQIASNATSRGWLSARSVGLANKLPDSLTGGAYMGMMDGVLVYTDVKSFSSTSDGWVRADRFASQLGYVFGGTASVTGGAAGGFSAALNAP